MDRCVVSDVPGPVEKRPLDRMLGDVGDRVLQAKKLVTRLEERLGPVLRPLEGSEKPKVAQPRVGSVVVCRLAGIDAELEALCVDVDRLLGRLDV